MKTFRKFYHFFAPYKGVFTAALILGLLARVLTNVQPFLYRYLVDHLADLNLRALLLIVLIYFTLRLGALLIGVVSDYISDRAVNPAIRDARLAIFSHLQNLDFAFHVAKKSGELISRINRGNAAFWEVHFNVNYELARDLFDLVMVGVAFSIISPKVVIILLVTVSLNLVISSYFLRKNMAARKIFNRYEDNVSHLIVDNLINYETVKYFVKEKREIKNLINAFKPWTRELWRFGNTFRYMDISVGLIFGSSIALILAITLLDLARGVLTPGDFVLTVSYILQLFPRFEGFIWRGRQVTKAYTDLKDYLEILDYPLVVLDPKEPVQIKEVKGVVNFEEVSFTYPSGQQALDNFSLHIPANSTIALVGRSGAGKTTFTRLLLRVYDVDAGSVKIDECDVRKMRKEDLRKLIGVVPQEPLLFNNTIGFNIGYPKDEIGQDEIENAARLANLHDFIVSLDKGYQTLVGERGVKLSGGQKQRLAIARVFLLNPPIIIFDEATSHLDSESERLIQESLERLAKDKTLIIIAHRLSTVMKADKIVVLEDGKIIEEGIHSQLIAEKGGIYQLLWQLQTEHVIG